MTTLDNLNDPDTVRQYRQGGKRKRPQGWNKHNAQKCEADGLSFDSLMEREYYFTLKMLLASGAIRDLDVHPKYTLQEAFTATNGERVRAITHTPDFRYVDTATGKVVVEDVKGHVTTDFRIRYRLFRKLYPGITYNIIGKGNMR